MLIISTQVNAAVFLVFLTLEAHRDLAVHREPHHQDRPCRLSAEHLIQVGGYIGVVTAIVAWYTSAAGVMNGHKGRVVLPVGSALFKL